MQADDGGVTGAPTPMEHIPASGPPLDEEELGGLETKVRVLVVTIKVCHPAAGAARTSVSGQRAWMIEQID